MVEIKRLSSFNDSSVCIEAFAPVDGDQYRLIIFESPRIDCLISFEENISGVVLKNGVTIPVAMSIKDLKQKIYHSNDETIDLTAVTGEVCKEAQRINLSKKFNPAAEESYKDRPLDIWLIARPHGSDRAFRRVKLQDSNILFYEPCVNNREKETFISLAEACDRYKEYYIYLPLPVFVERLNQAKKDGLDVLDLTEETRPKNGQKFTM